MSLPSDNNRQLENMLRIGTIKAIDWDSKPRLVRIEVDEGVLSDWMPYSQPFIGGTWFWCAPKIGISGLVVSEGGNNDVCRFYPCFNTEADDPDLTEDDFELHFKNDDYIKHDAAEGNLSIKVTNKFLLEAKSADILVEETIKIESTDLNIENTSTTLKAQTINLESTNYTNKTNIWLIQASTAMISAPGIFLNGGVTIGSGSERGNARSFASNWIATINIPVRVNALMDFIVDPTTGDIIFKSGDRYTLHKHGKVEVGGGTSGVPE